MKNGVRTRRLSGILVPTILPVKTKMKVATILDLYRRKTQRSLLRGSGHSNETEVSQKLFQAPEAGYRDEQDS